MTLHEENLNLLVNFSWYRFEKKGWFTKLITGKTEKKVWEARHADVVLVQDLRQIVKYFVEGNLAQLDPILPNERKYQFNEH
ncbi:hypothetical protein OQZ33_14165 [Pedobacter sp. MC2016-05]|uniref:hypothetical protein n=1 Tax=Pedobacter sp. MC2016-05 TaxID=2994474 RepID=UPI002246AB43|nr:hypothetical protein [Pedobacter sp. MC2016-05]MCX2475479.1 hypothetical protein [Pedobacter sp. MC2016-05]